MEIDGVEIADEFAEAFPMTAARVIVTAATRDWAETVGRIATGFATSVIGCDCEASVDRLLDPDETPDGRPGVQLLFFAFSSDRLQKALVKRIGQCVLTCPTTACFDALPPGTFDAKPEKRIRVGGFLRYFGDGFQISKKLGDRRFWRIPAMDGEFLCEDTFGTVKGVGGGNFLVLSRDQDSGLRACEQAAAAMRILPDVILPFPGGCVRSGSKVGSRYTNLVASTNEAYCPTLRAITKSALPPDVQCAYEVVIDGLTVAAIEEATRVGVKAACRPGVLQITAGNYGGKLGPFHMHLHKIMGG